MANEGWKKIEKDSTGFAVGEDDLRVDYDRNVAELVLNTPEELILRNAIESYKEVPNGLTGSIQMSRFDSSKVFRDNLSAFKMVADALKYYENNEAGIGEDKAAKDLRTKFNHCRKPIREELD